MAYRTIHDVALELQRGGFHEEREMLNLLDAAPRAWLASQLDHWMIIPETVPWKLAVHVRALVERGSYEPTGEEWKALPLRYA